MSKINLVLLVIISLMAICVDSYAGYALFLMLAMPIGHYLSPFLLLFLVISVPVVFISSLIGLFYFKRWSYWAFFVTTLLLHAFLGYTYIYFVSIKAIKTTELKWFFPVVSLLIFVIYFLLPTTRRLFRK